jgi:transcriptional regulator with XRE-family HTH domain
MDITLVVFGDESVKISGDLVDEVASFIDAISEQEILEKEYNSGDIYRDEEIRVCSAPIMPDYLEFESDEEFDDSDEDLDVENQEVDAGVKKLGSLDDVLKGIYTDSFEKHLQKIINKKGLKNSEVYAAANISKQYFSKLLKGQVTPSKEKMLALAVGLRLNLDETVDFLRIAGYALSPISQTDAVVEYFIELEDDNVLKIDIVLFDYGLDPLSKG